MTLIREITHGLDIIVRPHLPRQVGQLGDVHRYAPSLIESKGVCYSGMARISVAVDIGECLSIRVHDLEAAV